MIPVLAYYRLLQSTPATGAPSCSKDLSNLRNPATMRAYWADWIGCCCGASRAPAGEHLGVIHVEPDLWGYLEQAHADGARARASHDQLIALRDGLAPHVRSRGI